MRVYKITHSNGFNIETNETEIYGEFAREKKNNFLNTSTYAEAAMNLIIIRGERIFSRLPKKARKF